MAKLASGASADSPLPAFIILGIASSRSLFRVLPTPYVAQPSPGCDRPIILSCPAANCYSSAIGNQATSRCRHRTILMLDTAPHLASAGCFFHRGLRHVPL
ncbi:hypothetical protein BDV10DRAFT_116632 [Aspergillus recurvatus]